MVLEEMVAGYVLREKWSQGASFAGEMFAGHVFKEMVAWACFVFCRGNGRTTCFAGEMVVGHVLWGKWLQGVYFAGQMVAGNGCNPSLLPGDEGFEKDGL